MIKGSAADLEIVWALLAECDGYSESAHVARKVERRFPETPSVRIASILSELEEAGAIGDSREAFSAFHPLTDNPQDFGRALSPAEVAAYTRSPRLPVLDGTDRYSVEQLPTELAELQAVRRSCRSFAARTLERRELGHVLASAYRVPMLGGPPGATPSGGGLYPLKIYLINLHPAGELAVGYYEYDPEAGDSTRGDRSSSDGLGLVRAEARLDEGMLAFAFDSEEGALPHRAPVAIVIAADMMRHPGKYSNRGYRYTLIEAGLAVQNIVLASTELGIASLPYCGFHDENVARELAMDQVSDDPERVRPLVAVLLGYREDESGPSIKATADSLETALVGRGKPIASVWSTQGFGDDAVFVSATAATRRADNRRHITLNSGRDRSTSVARVRAMAEALERYASGVVRVDRQASAQQLTNLGCDWLDPRQVAPLTDEQYAALPGLQQFAMDDSLQWVEGYRASGRGRVLVPVDLAFYPLLPQRWGRKAIVSATSNGVAAYGDEAGAVERGLLELIERHAMMRNWFHRESPPRIPIDALPYPWQRRAEHWATHGRQVHVLNLSGYAHGAVAVEVAITSDSEQPHFMCGAAASLTSFEDAVGRAFMEADWMTHAISKRPFKRRIRPEKVHRVHDHAHLYSFPEYSATLSWLVGGEQVADVPQPNTDIDSLLFDLDPVVVRHAPLHDQLNTVVTKLSPTATRLLENAPLVVARVISQKLIPIHFGQGGGHYSHSSLDRPVAPESIRLPQYFA